MPILDARCAPAGLFSTVFTLKGGSLTKVAPVGGRKWHLMGVCVSENRMHSGNPTARTPRLAPNRPHPGPRRPKRGPLAAAPLYRTKPKHPLDAVCDHSSARFYIYDPLFENPIHPFGYLIRDIHTSATQKNRGSAGKARAPSKTKRAPRASRGARPNLSAFQPHLLRSASLQLQSCPRHARILSHIRIRQRYYSRKRATARPHYSQQQQPTDAPTRSAPAA